MRVRDTYVSGRAIYARTVVWVCDPIGRTWLASVTGVAVIYIMRGDDGVGRACGFNFCQRRIDAVTAGCFVITFRGCFRTGG